MLWWRIMGTDVFGRTGREAKHLGGIIAVEWESPRISFVCWCSQPIEATCARGLVGLGLAW